MAHESNDIMLRGGPAPAPEQGSPRRQPEDSVRCSMMENISPSLDPGTKDLMLCGLEHGIAPKKDVGEGVSITMLGVVTQDEPQHCLHVVRQRGSLEAFPLQLHAAELKS